MSGAFEARNGVEKEGCMNNQSITEAQIIQIGVSCALLVVGIFLFGGVLDAGDPQFWLATVIVLAGVFAWTVSITISTTLMGIGGFMLLNDLGIIRTPVLGIALSGLLVVVGLFGIVTTLFNGPLQQETTEQ